LGWSGILQSQKESTCDVCWSLRRKKQGKNWLEGDPGRKRRPQKKTPVYDDESGYFQYGRERKRRSSLARARWARKKRWRGLFHNFCRGGSRYGRKRMRSSLEHARWARKKRWRGLHHNFCRGGNRRKTLQRTVGS